MFKLIRKWLKKHSCDRSFNGELLRQSEQTLDFMQRQADYYQNKDKYLVDSCVEVGQQFVALSNAYGKTIEEFDLGNGTVKRFVVDDVGVVRNTGSKYDEQRCKYCGCLVSSFDTHCKSCSAPI